MPRSVARHRSEVEGLLREALLGDRQRAPEVLEVSPRLLAEHPARYRDRVLAEEVRAAADLPGVDNSQMDGYAVRAADLPGALPVGGMIAAGHATGELPVGTAAPIMTGAPLPRGADAVVPVERAEPAEFVAPGATVSLPPIASGTFVRRAGSDAAAGELLLAEGAALSAGAWGALSAAGVERVAVRPRPRVLLVSTGLELREASATLEPGQVHDANGASLTAALTSAGAAVTPVLLSSDDPEALLAVLREKTARADLIITSGGVSAGAHEVVRLALEPLGVVFGPVAMQPGGPQGLGLVDLGAGPQPVVALPGNPVSVLVSMEMFLRPVLREFAGHATVDRGREHLPLAESLDSPAGKLQVRRARRDENGRVALVGGPGSHLLSAYARATLLALVPADVEHLDAGDTVEVLSIDD